MNGNECVEGGQQLEVFGDLGQCERSQPVRRAEMRSDLGGGIAHAMEIAHSSV